jgi:hypothetical protein
MCAPDPAGIPKERVCFPVRGVRARSPHATGFPSTRASPIGVAPATASGAARVVVPTRRGNGSAAEERAVDGAEDAVATLAADCTKLGAACTDDGAVGVGATAAGGSGEQAVDASNESKMERRILFALPGSFPGATLETAQRSNFPGVASELGGDGLGAFTGATVAEPEEARKCL